MAGISLYFCAPTRRRRLLERAAMSLVRSPTTGDSSPRPAMAAATPPDAAEPLSVAEDGAPAGDDDSSAAPGSAAKRIMYSYAMDLHLVRCVSASRAHVAGYGDKKKKFEKVLADCQSEPCFAGARSLLTRKSVQDRYRKLLLGHKKEQRICAGRSGADDEQVTSLDSLLADMVEAEDDLKARRETEKRAAVAATDGLLRAGEALRSAALSRSKRPRLAASSGDSTSGDAVAVDDGDAAVEVAGSERRSGADSRARSLSSDDVEVDEVEVIRKAERAQGERLAVEKERLALKAKISESTRSHQSRMEEMESAKIRNDSERLRIEDARLKADIADREARLKMDQDRSKREHEAQVAQTTLMAALIDRLKKQ